MNKPIIDNPILFMDIICEGFVEKLKNELKYDDRLISLFKAHYYLGARTACESLIHAGVIDSTKINQLIQEIENHPTFQTSPIH